jgi:hypothetical protein
LYFMRHVLLAAGGAKTKGLLCACRKECLGRGGIGLALQCWVCSAAAPSYTTLRTVRTSAVDAAAAAAACMPPAAPSTAPLRAPLLLHLDCCCFPGHRIAPAQAAAAAAASVRGALAAHPKAAEEGGTRGSGGVGGGRGGCVHRSWRFCMPQGHSTTASHSTLTSMSACQHLSDARVAHTCVILLWLVGNTSRDGARVGRCCCCPSLALGAVFPNH